MEVPLKFKPGDKAVVIIDESVGFRRIYYGQVVTIKDLDRVERGVEACWNTLEVPTWIIRSHEMELFEVYNSPLYKIMQEDS